MSVKRQTEGTDRGSEWHGPGGRHRDSRRGDDPPHPVLFGRDTELGLIRSLLESSSAGGRALLFVAEPGLGKTALLDEADRLASTAGWRVLRVAGAEFEADVGFSGLHQALVPLVGEFQRLGPVHRQALSAALGFTDGAPPDRLDVFNASLTVIRGAPDAPPTLLIVDDVQWLDRATVGALNFMAGRLAGSRIGLIAAARPDAGGLFERGFAPHELQPLGDAAASRLLDARSPALDGRLRLGVFGY
jgi:hypothetical protein